MIIFALIGAAVLVAGGFTLGSWIHFKTNWPRWK